MFKNHKLIDLPEVKASIESCVSTIKRVAFLDDNAVLILENGDLDFSVHKFDMSGTKINTWKVSSEELMCISSYQVIGDAMYMVFLKPTSEYDEEFIIYKSDENCIMHPIVTMPRESYRHNMDYCYLFEKDNNCQLLVIRHNRIHLYAVSDSLYELQVLHGDKWFISGDFIVNSMGNDWELYDTSLELINIFRFKEDVEWVYIDASNDGNIIAMVTDNNTNDVAGLYVYDKTTDTYNAHFQRYSFDCAAVCAGKVWTSVSHEYSHSLGGVMIFDKDGVLEYAGIASNLGNNEHLKVKNNYPEPLITWAQNIEDISHGLVMLSDNEKIVMSDLFCNKLQELKHDGYDCYALSNDKTRLGLLTFNDREYTSSPDDVFSAKLEIYEWDSDWQQSNIIDLSSLLK